MSPSVSARSTTLAPAVVAGLVLALVAPVSPASSWAARAPAPAWATTLVRLYAERLATADTVAAAKWGTDRPIDDPARERRILAGAAERAGALGVSPALATRVLTDQIEAGKLVQRGLYRSWERHSAQRPRTRPDLARTVRPRLDRVDAELLSALAAAGRGPAGERCTALMARAATARAAADRLDALHRLGLARAREHTCAGGAG
ncbi:gamma subclass chorismate mutase AroQ [Streptomyces sp. NPDC002574]|uniref:gamma subclass chorismate mutase AroQ n=1 Tax=Streptomyces sp. NPDC002574 TaxID=3364652 RepID=UPI00369AC951